MSSRKSFTQKKRDERIQKQVEKLGGPKKTPKPKTLRQTAQKQLERAKLIQQFPFSSTSKKVGTMMDAAGFKPATEKEAKTAFLRGTRGLYEENVPKELRDRIKFEKVQKKKDGGSVRKQNVDLIVAFEEGKKKRRQKKERTGNPKVDKLMEEFEDVKGYKFGDNIGKKDGGLAEAIKKVKAKEMKDGGSVGDKLREEVSKSRRGKASGSISMKEMDRIMRKVGIDSGVFEKPVKKAQGGPIRRRRPKAFRSRLDDAVEEFIETIEPFQGTVRKGETLRNIDGKTMIVRRTPNPNFGNMISDRDRAMVGAMLGEGGRMISDRDRRMVSQMMGARKMEDGGVVPAKFKGFSK